MRTAHATLANELRSLAVIDRESLLDALRQYLSFRVPPSQRRPEHAVPEARLWMALDIAEHLELNELKPDIESLLAAVCSGQALDQIDEKMIARYLQRLKA